MPVSQSNRFVFTFNRTDNDIEQDIPFSIHTDKLKSRLQQSDVYGAIFQVEKGDDKSRLHIQGYIRFVKKVSTSFKHLQSLLQLPGAHFEVCKDYEAAIRYCSKEDTRQDGPFQFGDLTENQGSRSDIRKLISQVKSGVTLGDLAEGDHPEHVLKYHVAIEKLQVTSMKYHTAPVVVTHLTPQEAEIRAMDEDVYICSDGLFNDYHSQSICIWAHHRPPPPGFLFKLRTTCNKSLPCKGFLSRPSNIQQLLIIQYPDQKDEKALLKALSNALNLVTEN